MPTTTPTIPATPPMRILVPLDFSPVSRNALAIATDWARRGHGALHLVHVVERPGELLSRAEEELASIPVSDDGLVAERLVVVGRAADAITDLAARLGAELIAIGTSGRTGMSRLFLGSVAGEVVRRATCPVACVPRSAAALREPGGILCAIDFSDASRRAMECAIPLARRLDLGLTLLHTLELPVMSYAERLAMGDDPLAEERAALERALDAMRAEVAARGGRVSATVATGAAADEILRAARAAPYELIAMATHGRGGFARLAFGSVAEKVIAGAPCPVLLIGPGYPAAAPRR